MFLLTDFFAGKNAGKNQFSVVVFFCIFFLCMLTEKGLLSRIISRTGFCRLGKYSYSIYVMQEAAFYILSHTLWKKCRIFKAMSGSCTGTVCCPDHSFWRRYLLSGGKTDANSGEKINFFLLFVNLDAISTNWWALASKENFSCIRVCCSRTV